jgi:hypothetical protein
VTLPLRDVSVLTKSAWAGLDSFPLATLEPYGSIVTRRSPVESRPPSIYRPVWIGRYYQLWQRQRCPRRASSNTFPSANPTRDHTAAAATGRPNQPLCSIEPVASLPCTEVQGLARKALAEHAELLAYQRPAPIVVRADQGVWQTAWFHDPEARTLTPTIPGAAVGHITVASAQGYELWLDGSFARGFDVSVDGRPVGRVKNQLGDFSGYVHLADLSLDSGAHTFVLTHPHADLTSGSGWAEFDSLSAIALQPQESPTSELISVTPAQARSSADARSTDRARRKLLIRRYASASPTTAVSVGGGRSRALLPQLVDDELAHAGHEATYAKRRQWEGGEEPPIQ